MTEATSLLSQVCDAQTRNSTLGGEALRSGGRQVAALAIRGGYEVMAADESGERLVAAALLADDRVRAVDVSRRLDGRFILLVSGYLAGTTGIDSKTALARSLGATDVLATLLGPRGGVTIVGGDHMMRGGHERHLLAL